MSYYAKSLVLIAASCAVLMLPSVASALDIGGSNGVSVSGRNGGLSVSVGGASGVNASVGSSSSGGLGVNASVGGASGVSSRTSVGGSGSGLGVGTSASVGGSSGVNANVNATVGGSRLASASADVGLGGNSLLNLGLGIPSTGDPGNPGGPGTGGTGINGSGVGNTRFVSMYNDMSSAEKAKMKVRCKDVLRSGGFEAGLVKLCKMVVAMR